MKICPTVMVCLLTLVCADRTLQAQSTGVIESESLRGAASPDTSLGAPNNFGQRVDLDGNVLGISDDLAVFAADATTLALESGDLLGVAPAELTTDVTAVHDVAVNGEQLAVICGRAGKADLVLSFVRSTPGGVPTWSFEASFDFDSGLGVTGQVSQSARIVWVNGLIFLTSAGAAGNRSFTAVLRSPNSGDALEQLGFVSQLLEARLLEISAGMIDTPLGLFDDTTTGVLYRVDGVLEAWFNLGTDAFPFYQFGSLAPTAPATEPDTVLLIAGGDVFIGRPYDITAGSNSGAVDWLDFNASGGAVDSVTLFAKSPAAGKRFGRSLAGAVELLAIGAVESELLPGSSQVGVVHLARFDGSVWALSGEAWHAIDTALADGEDFAADLSVSPDAAGVAAGAPGGELLAGSVSVLVPATASYFELELSTELAGFGGVAPQLCLAGATLDGQPIFVELSDARPSSAGFLILGLSSLNLPFKMGVMYPSVDIVRNLPTSGAGGASLSTAWPTEASLLGRFDTHVQYWVQDSDAPAGFASSGGAVIHQF